MLLEARDICFQYNKNHVILNHLNLAVAAGERVALVGASGCGKSTLAAIMAGYLSPSSGQVLFEGKALPQAGYCPVQLIYQHPEKAINPRRRLRQSLTEAWNPDDKFLKDMGIEQEWLTRYPTELSGGELQRFCIARALGPQTKFVIADEMSSMLDMITQAQIWEVMLKTIEQRRLGLLIVTHSLDLAKQICSRVVSFKELNRSILL